MSPLLSGHIRLELHGAHERVRDQAGAFRFLEELPGLLGIGGPRDREKGPNRDARKSRGALDAIELAFAFATESDPHQRRRASNGAERENEAVNDGSDEQRLGRPPVAGAAVLGGGAVARVSRPLDAIATDPSKFADASTLYRWGRLFIVFLLSEPGILS